jgi:putative transposase
MVSPAQRRAVVRWAQETYRLSERRTCRALAVHRSPIRYQSRRPDDGPLRQRLRELAADRLTFGVKRLTTLLRREGRVINHKRVYRVYCEEGLQLRPRRKRRRRSAVVRLPRGVVTEPNQRWAMDFMHDVLSSGRTFRIFTLVDVCTRESLEVVARERFRGTDVVDVLTRVATERGTHPGIIQCDNGTEFTSVALDHSAYWNKLQLDFSRPGKPVDNCICEAFNGTLRRECLTLHWFRSLAEAQAELDGWRADYNNARPHTSLGHHPPVDWWQAGSHFPRAVAARN